jgi:hypothetical protein
LRSTIFTEHSLHIVRPACATRFPQRWHSSPRDSRHFLLASAFVARTLSSPRRLRQSSAFFSAHAAQYVRPASV